MQKKFTDQMNRVICLEKKPERIISLVPSQTELLYDLGLEKEIVGITKFCIHPPGLFKSKQRVGGTKKFDFEKIRKLNPDLIIGNKEENEKEQIEQLADEFPVWMSDICSLDDAFDMMKKLGELTGTSPKAGEIILRIRNSFTASDFPESDHRVLYFIWKDPWMVAGSDTFINQMLQLAGFKNCINTSRYPAVSEEEIKKINPSLVLLSSEPYPFSEKHAEELRKIIPGCKVMLVDGELFSWYGTRLQYSADYFKTVRAGATT